MMYTTTTSSQIENTPGTQYLDGADDYIEVSNSNLRANGPTTLEMSIHPVEPAYSYPRVLAVYGQDTHDVTCKNCDNIDFGYQVSYVFYLYDGSVMFRQYLTSSHRHEIIKKGKVVGVVTEYLDFDCTNTASLPSGYLNKWTHLAVTFDTNNVQIFVNGELASNSYITSQGVRFPNCPAVVSQSISPVIGIARKDTWGPFSVGKMTGYEGHSNGQRFLDTPYSGFVDKVAVYNRKLTNGEIRGLSNFRSGTSVNNVVHVEADFGASYTDVLGVKDSGGNRVPNPVDILSNWFVKGSSSPSSIVMELPEDGDYQKAKFYYGQDSKKNSFGLLVTRETGESEFTNIAVPKYNPETEQYEAFTIGTLGEGRRGDIVDENGKKLAGISNVSVEESPEHVWLKLKYDIEFYNELSGVSNYQKVDDGTYSVYSYFDHLNRRLLSGGSVWIDSGKSFVVDLTKPAVDNITIANASGENMYNVSWSGSDSLSWILRAFGDANYAGGGSGNATADDLTSGVTGYGIGSGGVGADLYSGIHLWTISEKGSPTSRTESVRLNNAQSEDISFKLSLFDYACNSTDDQEVLPAAEEGDPWISTKAGLVYSQGTNSFISPLFAEHSKFSNDSSWNSPFTFFKDESDITSEVFATGSSDISALLYSSKLGSATLSNYTPNVSKVEIFDDIVDLLEEKVEDAESKFVKLSYSGDASLSGNISEVVDSKNNGCNQSNKYCYIDISGILTVSSDLVCDRKAVIKADSIVVDADVTSSSRSNGCIFLSQGDITLDDGEYKSGGSSYPKYDIIEGYLIALNTVSLPLVDEEESVKDGIKVVGGLVGLGFESDYGISILRNLRLSDNTNYPVMAVHYDPKYVVLARELIGMDLEGNKREVGYKAY